MKVMKDLIILCLISAWLATLLVILLVMRIDSQSKEIQIASCQDSLQDYRNYLEQLRVPATSPVVDSLMVGNMFYNYAAHKINFYRRALSDADATTLIPQTPECLAAYQWLREKRGYPPAKAIKLTIRWWEKQ